MNDLCAIGVPYHAPGCNCANDGKIVWPEDAHVLPQSTAEADEGE